MKHLLLPFLALLLLSSCKKDQNDPVIPEPDPTYHSFTGEIGTIDNSTIISDDDNLLVYGRTAINLCVLKISKSGSLIWRNEFYAGPFTFAGGIAQTSDHNIFVCGYTIGKDFNSDIDILLVKLNSS